MGCWISCAVVNIRTGEPESFAPAGGRVPQNDVRFIQQAMADGLRNVLIIHGKGGKINRMPILSAAMWRAG